MSIHHVFNLVVLLAYVLTLFFAHVDWRHALAATFVPHLEWSCGFLAVLVVIPDILAIVPSFVLTVHPVMNGTTFDFTGKFQPIAPSA
jgi:hypothetical protein